MNNSSSCVVCHALCVTVLLLTAIVFLCSCTPAGFDVEYRRAEEKIGIGDNEAALAIYKKIAKNYPDDPRRPAVLGQIADIYANLLGDSDRAVEELGRVIEEYPLSEASVLAHEKRAAMLAKNGDIDGAIADFSALIKHFPEHENRYQYRMQLVYAYIAKRNYPQARVELIPLFDEKKLPPTIREQALFAAAESFFLEDIPESAISYYQGFLKEFPNSNFAAEAKLHLATCVEEMGYLGAARDITNEAAKNYPNKKVIDARIESLNKRGKAGTGDKVPGVSKRKKK